MSLFVSNIDLMAKVVFIPQDGKKRCEWCLKDQLYLDYHDNEWGIVCHSDNLLFEHLILETFQAGLSWYTILKKRENFRLAFKGFNPLKMAKFNDNDVKRLMQNKGIIRSRGKIEAAINNAKIFLELQKEFGSFDKYIWQFTNYKTITISINSWADVRTTIPESDAMSKDLKKRGFKFVGSTTCMAYMEAVGMVNDHFHDCWRNH
ncbi:MAG: DNA-3-methyladenine glycosylase I [Bacteroidia bacterium]|nr:DNA-3-methyladenine glycosylase I [Bacteroidia bacterium]